MFSLFAKEKLKQLKLYLRQEWYSFKTLHLTTEIPVLQLTFRFESSILNGTRGVRITVCLILSCASSISLKDIDSGCSCMIVAVVQNYLKPDNNINKNKFNSSTQICIILKMHAHTKNNKPNLHHFKNDKTY